MEKYSFEDFEAIIARLRAEDGCPWDREQTHESLKPCLIEETAETISAINIYQKTGSTENLVEELGDVLLQVVMHAQIASEEGLFTMEDILAGISQKMIRRHPHVFGDVSVENSDQVLDNWKKIKKQEKSGKEWVDQELPGSLEEIKDQLNEIKKKKFPNN